MFRATIRAAVLFLLPVLLSGAVRSSAYAQSGGEVAAVAPRSDASESDQPARGPAAESSESLPSEAAGGIAAQEALQVPPPFSLNDCVGLLDLSRSELEETAQEAVGPATGLRRQSILRILGSVSTYLKSRDDLHSSLVDYKWDRLAPIEVRDRLPRPLALRWQAEEMPRNVSALSFEADGGDVELHGLRVFDAAGEQIAEFDRSERNREVLLRHSLPRRYVFHLWRPSDVGRIELLMAKTASAADVIPEVSIHAGHTDRPEHGKSAIYFITEAEQNVRDEQLAAALEDIGQAQREIREYRKVLRNRR